ncbi:unnamed protein product [Rotaria sp. Silwood1]|nr:unnamed protein product [Rotaria sp. Silwood1]CAF1152420.1 unnamed protein product [Rotaria sp. Silwood1]
MMDESIDDQYFSQEVSELYNDGIEQISDQKINNHIICDDYYLNVLGGQTTPWFADNVSDDIHIYTQKFLKLFMILICFFGCTYFTWKVIPSGVIHFQEHDKFMFHEINNIHQDSNDKQMLKKDSARQLDCGFQCVLHDIMLYSFIKSFYCKDDIKHCILTEQQNGIFSYYNDYVEKKFDMFEISSNANKISDQPLSCNKQLLNDIGNHRKSNSNKYYIRTSLLEAKFDQILQTEQNIFHKHETNVRKFIQLVLLKIMHFQNQRNSMNVNKESSKENTS